MPRNAFREIPNRAACSTLVGYGYQVDLTILRWLKLSGSETLELECGEDIDTLVRAPSDCPEDIIRRLEQVKALKHRVTLKSPSGVAAFLANCVYHDQLNADLSLRFKRNLWTASVESVEGRRTQHQRGRRTTCWHSVHSQIAVQA